METYDDDSGDGTTQIIYAREETLNTFVAVRHRLLKDLKEFKMPADKTAARRMGLMDALIDMQIALIYDDVLPQYAALEEAYRKAEVKSTLSTIKGGKHVSNDE